MKLLPIPVAALLLAGAGASLAQTPDSELARCAGIAEPSARLACLDPLAAAALARQQPAARAAAQAKSQEQAFGVATITAAAGATEAPDTLSSEIAGYVEGWQANSHFTLKNGQVWRVSDGSSGYLDLQDPKVTLKRSLLGSYFLEFAGRNGAPKVKRVR